MSSADTLFIRLWLLQVRALHHWIERASINRLILTRNATTLDSLIRPRAVTRCNLAVSDMYMRDFGKTHQIAYTYCSVGISDLQPLTGTSEDQLPHRKSRSLATA